MKNTLLSLLICLGFFTGFIEAQPLEEMEKIELEILFETPTEVQISPEPSSSLGISRGLLAWLAAMLRVD